MPSNPTEYFGEEFIQETPSPKLDIQGINTEDMDVDTPERDRQDETRFNNLLTKVLQLTGKLKQGPQQKQPDIFPNACSPSNTFSSITDMFGFIDFSFFRNFDTFAHSHTSEGRRNRTLFKCLLLHLANMKVLKIKMVSGICQLNKEQQLEMPAYFKNILTYIKDLHLQVHIKQDSSAQANDPS